jgi:hypothetical protein
MNDDWLVPWFRIDDESIRSALDKELERELNRGHPLWGSSPRKVLAKRNDQDDILVSFDSGKIAEVHLTWTRKREQDGYPKTVIFSSLEDWRVRSMIPLHEEFLATGG